MAAQPRTHPEYYMSHVEFGDCERNDRGKFALPCECALLRLQIDAEWFGVLPWGGAKTVLSRTHPERYAFYVEFGH